VLPYERNKGPEGNVDLAIPYVFLLPYHLPLLASMADLSYPAYSIFSFISFVIVLIPLPWHLQALNSGTCLFMIWTAIGCLNLFINSIIWHGNIIDWAPIWCDICASGSFIYYSPCNSIRCASNAANRWRLCGDPCCISLYQPTAIYDCILSTCYNYPCTGEPYLFNDCSRSHASF
jgi:Pheromone A receptor